MLHLPDALGHFGSALAIAAWSFERLHQISKAVGTNNTSIEVSIMNNSITRLKYGVYRSVYAELKAAQSGLDMARWLRSLDAKQYHGEPHRLLFSDVPQVQRHIDMGLLSAETTDEWPLAIGQSKQMPTPTAVAEEISDFLSSRAAQTGLVVRRYEHKDEERYAGSVEVRVVLLSMEIWWFRCVF